MGARGTRQELCVEGGVLMKVRMCMCTMYMGPVFMYIVRELVEGDGSNRDGWCRTQSCAIQNDYSILFYNIYTALYL